MTLTPDKVLSRDFKIEVNTGTIAVPVWTQIMGLDEDGIAFKQSTKETDFKDANDAGIDKPVIIGRGWGCTLKGARMEDSDDGTRDPGQAAVEAVQDATGYDAQLQFRISSPAAAGAETITFVASVASVDAFGGVDKASWTAELRLYGLPVRA